ncbi:MAG TPA: polysaccharide deacetylase family protein [Rhodanobacteraceae bacterium]|nr:polysaccharide deacetylase family protein [Rhodanobacteraceae bacterium]
MRVPVLTYHAVNIAGNDYHDNDHVAFAADLRLIGDLGLRIVPLVWLVEQHLGVANRDLTRCVALSCDDGSDFDYFDLDHPTHGRQRSLFNCLRDYRREHVAQAQPNLHLTSFVIASTQARNTIDRECLVGRGWMRDSWWRAALVSGLMAIENHSFDHNHPCLPTPGADDMPRGSVMHVDNALRAEAEIETAQQFLNDRLAPRRSRLFCYPFGHVPDYLRLSWLPQHGSRCGLLAAFGDGAKPVTAAADIWNLPRYICGWHWKSPDELRAILTDACR